VAINGKARLLKHDKMKEKERKKWKEGNGRVRQVEPSLKRGMIR